MSLSRGHCRLVTVNSKSPLNCALSGHISLKFIHSSIRVLPCLHCRSETGTAPIMTSGLTRDHLHISASGVCGWSRAREHPRYKVQSVTHVTHAGNTPDSPGLGNSALGSRAQSHEGGDDSVWGHGRCGMMVDCVTD